MKIDIRNLYDTVYFRVASSQTDSVNESSRCCNARTEIKISSFISVQCVALVIEYKFIYMTLHRWIFRFFTRGWVQKFWGTLKILG